MIIAGVRLNSEEKILMDSSLNSKYHWCLQMQRFLWCMTQDLFQSSMWIANFKIKIYFQVLTETSKFKLILKTCFDFKIGFQFWLLTYVVGLQTSQSFPMQNWSICSWWYQKSSPEADNSLRLMYYSLFEPCLLTPNHPMQKAEILIVNGSNPQCGSPWKCFV